MSNSTVLEFQKITEEQINIFSSEINIAVLEWDEGKYVLDTIYSLDLNELKEIVLYLEKLNEN